MHVSVHDGCSLKHVSLFWYVYKPVVFVVLILANQTIFNFVLYTNLSLIYVVESRFANVFLNVLCEHLLNLDLVQFSTLRIGSDLLSEFSFFFLRLLNVPFVCGRV